MLPARAIFDLFGFERLPIAHIEIMRNDTRSGFQTHGRGGRVVMPGAILSELPGVSVTCFNDRVTPRLWRPLGTSIVLVLAARLCYLVLRYQPGGGVVKRPHIETAALLRTARKLMDGTVFV